MYSTDPIADMLTRIRNALMRQKNEVIIPYSNIKHTVANIFLKYKFVAKIKIQGKDKDKVILIDFTDDKLPISPINELKKLSKPGRRIYCGWQQIPYVKSGRGIVIISTDKGIMTGEEAKRKKVGGEIICSIY